VALRCDLEPLDIRETAAYIAGRLKIAGGECANIFTREAVQTIYDRSRGIPRTISVICDNALVTGFAAGVRPVGSNVVLEVCRDFRLLPAKEAAAPGVLFSGHEAAVGRDSVVGRESVVARGFSPAGTEGRGFRSPAEAREGEGGSPAAGAQPVKSAPRVLGDADMFGSYTKPKRFRFF
jgi:general secretion pathway protein A